MSNFLYIAVDLGAGSGRVFLAGLSSGEFLLEQIHRFQYPPRQLDGHLRWDFAHIFSEIKTGLSAAAERANVLGRPIHSLGVDSWAVDYGLIGAAGNLIEDPICYRDERTANIFEQLFKQMPREEIYARTGIQFLTLNTSSQLCAHAHEGVAANADRLLLIPDLINFFLTGKAVTEYTNATTMQMVNAESRTWDSKIIAALNLPQHLFTEIISAGDEVGLLKSEIAEELNLQKVKVIAPATHDTGSAVAGAPLLKDWAYISSGTWSLVGVELDAPVINEATSEHNFTNEGGAFGTIRFLKNVMGLWLLESCRKEWQAKGLSVDYEGLLSDVAKITGEPVVIFPDDERLFNPPSMLAAIKELLTEDGQKIRDEPAFIAKVILDSLAVRYASVIRTIEELTGNSIRGLQIVGGGSQNNYLNQATANACKKPVLAGPIEATVIGNVLVQAVAAGRFPTLNEARQQIAGEISLKQFTTQ